MAELDPRHRKQPNLYGKSGPAFAVGDEVRARQGKTVHYWPAKVLEIQPEYMLVEWRGEYEEMCTARVAYDGIKRPGADGQYASAGSSWRDSRFLQQGNHSEEEEGQAGTPGPRLGSPRDHRHACPRGKKPRRSLLHPVKDYALLHLQLPRQRHVGSAGSPGNHPRSGARR